MSLGAGLPHGRSGDPDTPTYFPGLGPHSRQHHLTRTSQLLTLCFCNKLGFLVACMLLEICEKLLCFLQAFKVFKLNQLKPLSNRKSVVEVWDLAVDILQAPSQTRSDEMIWNVKTFISRAPGAQMEDDSILRGTKMCSGVRWSHHFSHKFALSSQPCPATCRDDLQNSATNSAYWQIT